MFEVGKTYQHTSTAGQHTSTAGPYKCLATYNNGTVGWLAFDGDTRPATETWNHNWTEVRPRIKVEGWVNVYDDFTSQVYTTKEDAVKKAAGDVLATIRVTGEEE